MNSICNHKTVNKNSQIIFIVGNSRSGTTMMGRILGQSPKVFTFRELHFFEQLWTPQQKKQSVSIDKAASIFMKLITTQRDGYLTPQKPLFYKKEAYSILETIYDNQFKLIDVFKLFTAYESSLEGKNISCDHTPRNVYYINEILSLFPEAKIINMIRDPRDVLLSQKNKWKRRFLGGGNIPVKETIRSWINYHPITISQLWKSAISAAEIFENHPKVFHLCFEDLITIPQKKIEDVCNFLNLQYLPQMLDIPVVGSSHILDQPINKGINIKSEGRWQNGGLTEAELFFCQKITMKYMQKYNYLPADTKLFSATYFLSSLYFPIKLGFAFCFNLHRMKNIFETIKRRIN